MAQESLSQPKPSTLPKPGEKVKAEEEAALAPKDSEFLDKLLAYDPELSDSEIAYWDQISQKQEKTNWDQAVLYLGVIARVKPNETEELKLEDEMQSLNLDVFKLLKQNPYLQPIAVADRTITFLKGTYDSEEFKARVLQVFEGKAQSWTQLWKTILNQGGIAEPQHPETPVVSEMEESIAIETVDVSPSSYHAADLLLGDSLLIKAKRLAERGNYKSAIGQAHKIPQKDPFFPEAQEKIKQFSNLAVQSLRQKAAQAFQSSLPAHDIKTKTAYLEEAKKYLEEALTDYPAADHLKTVQENLAVITRDLSNIQEQNRY